MKACGSALASRNVGKLEGLAAETGAAIHACDAADPAEAEALFARMEPALGGPPDVVVYNASGRLRGPIVDLDPDAVRQSVMVSAFGGFLVAQAGPHDACCRGRHGAILLTGASASVKGHAESAAFAMGKFGLRGLSQSLARELQPKGIHVAHFVIDGGIRSAKRPEPADAPDSLLDPDAIASAYWDVLRQDRSAWTSEIALPPWVERF